MCKIPLPLGILLSLWYYSTEGTELKMEEFTSSPGIYFDDLGPTHLLSSQWKIIIFYNLTNYNLELNTFNKYLDKISILCTTLKQIDRHNNNCDLLQNQFHLHLQAIKDQNSLFTNQNVRKRRGAVNAVGHAFNFMFGLLDQNDAQHYEDEILKTKNNQQHLLHLIHNQTLIADSTLSILKHSQRDIEHQFHIFDQHLNDIDAKLNDGQFKNSLTMQLNTLTTYTILLLMRYQEAQKSLIKMITSSTSGHLNPQIIPPSVLIPQLSVIRHNIPKQLALPSVENKLDVNLIYRLASVKTRVLKNIVIIEAFIPLISTEVFQLFHLIPLPVKLNDTFFFVQPNNNYMLANYHRDHFSSLTENSVSSCTTTSTNERFCKLDQPISARKTTQFLCETLLLDHPSSIPSSCTIKTCPLEKMFKPLSNNRQLFSVDRPYVADLICNNLITQHTIRNTGILEIPADCSFRIGNTILYPTEYHSSFVHHSYTPSLNLTFENYINFSQPRNHAVDFHPQNLVNLSQLIAQQESSSKEFPPNLSFSHHDVHHYVVTYTILTCLIICLGLYLYKTNVLKKTCKTKQVFTPTTLEPTYTSINLTPNKEQTKTSDNANHKDKVCIKIEN